MNVFLKCGIYFIVITPNEHWIVYKQIILGGEILLGLLKHNKQQINKYNIIQTLYIDRTT